MSMDSCRGRLECRRSPLENTNDFTPGESDGLIHKFPYL